MMPTTIEAVFQDGIFRPKTPVELPEGTTVQVTVLPTPAPFDPAAVLARIQAAHAKFIKETDNPEVTSENVDQILYGSPKGAR